MRRLVLLLLIATALSAIEEPELKHQRGLFRELTFPIDGCIVVRVVALELGDPRRMRQHRHHPAVRKADKNDG